MSEDEIQLKGIVDLLNAVFVNQGRLIVIE